MPLSSAVPNGLARLARTPSAKDGGLPKNQQASAAP